MTRFLRRTVAPASAPVTLAEAKAQLRIDHDDEDTLLGRLIDSAATTVEEMTGRALVTQTWRLDMPAPSGRAAIRLERAPVAALSAAVYTDGAGAEQTLALDDLRLYGDADAPLVEPVSGKTWPAAGTDVDAMRITFVAGYGDADAVPEPLRQAVLLLVAHQFERREAVGLNQLAAMPFGVTMLTDLYRLGWAAA